jgi:hypothetical protein
MPQLAPYKLDRLVDFSKDEGTPVEPLTLQQVKDHLRITTTDDDAYLTTLIPACRAGLEEYCNISIVEKDIVIVADINTEFELPWGPVSTLTTAEYKGSLSEAFAAKTSGTDFYTEGINFLRFVPTMCGRWKLTYTAGYTTVPADLLLDLKRIIGYCERNRGDQELTSLQGGIERPKSLDEALELFASKHVRKFWT